MFTTEAQPPDHITTPAGHTIVAKDSFGTQKWLGCMLSAIRSGNADANITLHIICKLPRVLSIQTKAYSWIGIFPPTRNWNSLRPPRPRSLLSSQSIAVSDNVTFTSLMLNSEDWCGQWWGLHLEFVGLALGLKSYVYGTHVCNKSRIHTRKNHGGRLRCVIIGNW